MGISLIESMVVRFYTNSVDVSGVTNIQQLGHIPLLMTLCIEDRPNCACTTSAWLSAAATHVARWHTARYRILMSSRVHQKILRVVTVCKNNRTRSSYSCYWLRYLTLSSPVSVQSGRTSPTTVTCWQGGRIRDNRVTWPATPSRDIGCRCTLYRQSNRRSNTAKRLSCVNTFSY